MTKIKNTKKGMAKKTLSISLAVAMLATSNVPVWAAEDLFTDGEVAVEAFDEADAFTAEEADAPAEEAAPTVEEVEAPAAKASSDVYDDTELAKYKTPEWGDKLTVPAIKFAGSNEDLTGDVQLITYWLRNGNQISGTATSENIDAADDADNVDNEIKTIFDATNAKAPTPTKKDCIDGAEFGLRVIIYVNGEINFTQTYNFGAAKKVDLTARLDDDEIRARVTFADGEYNGKEHKPEAKFVDNYKYGDALLWGNDYDNDKTDIIKLNDFAWDYVRYINGKKDLISADYKVNGEKVDVVAEVTAPGYCGTFEKTDAFNIWRKTLNNEDLDVRLSKDAYEFTGGTVVPAVSDLTVNETATGDNLTAFVKSVQAKGDGWVGEDKAATFKFDFDKAGVINNYKATIDADDVDVKFKVDDTFDIVARDLSKCTMEITEEFHAGDLHAVAEGTHSINEFFTLSDGNGNGNVKILDAEGNELTGNGEFNKFITISKVTEISSTKYTLTVSANDEKHDGVVQVVKEKTENIASPKLSLKNCKVYLKADKKELVIEEQEYTEVPYEIKKSDIYINDYLKGDNGNYTTLLPEEYEVVLDQNTDAGQHYIKIVGHGAYEGSTLKIPYTVKQAKYDKCEFESKVVVNNSYTKAEEYAEAIGLKVIAKNGAPVGKRFTLKPEDVDVKYDFGDTVDRYGNPNTAHNTITVTGTITNNNFRGGDKTFTCEVELVHPSIADANMEILGEYTFTGKEIIPDVKVTAANGTVLKEGVDYRLDVKHGLHAGEAEAVITAIKDCNDADTKTIYEKGSTQSKKFTIKPANINDVKTDDEFIYTGEAIEPALGKETGGLKLTLGKNDVTDFFNTRLYAQDYKNNVNAGTATVKVTVKDQWEHDFTASSADVAFKILPVEITKEGTFTVYADNGHIVNFKAFEGFDYDGTEKEFKDAKFDSEGVKLNGEDYALVKDKDYTIEYSNNKYPDPTGNNGKTASVFVKLSQNFIYVDEKDSDAVPTNVIAKADFRIKKASVEKAAVHVEKYPVYANGKAVYPTMAVTVDGKKLVEGTDYKLVYAEDETFEASAKDAKTVTVVGLNGYVDSETTGTWGIDKKDLKSADITVLLDKESYGPFEEPKVLCVFDGSVRMSEDEYTAVVTDKFAGLITVTAAEKNYTGVKEVTASVTRPSLENAEVSVKNPVYNLGKKVTPVVTVKAYGKDLTEGEDYELVYAEDETFTAGTDKKVIVKGLGIYEGSEQEAAWGIEKKAITSEDIKVTLDKTVCTPDEEPKLISVMDGKVLVDEAEYTTSYDAETGIFTVTAAEQNYTGSTSVTVTIEDTKPATPVIESVSVVGNKVTVNLAGECENAMGYDYVIDKDIDSINTHNYYKVNKNQLKTTTDFTYVQQGTYYVYCHAYTRDENGQKVFSGWSEAYEVVTVNAVTPAQPAITSVKVNGTTVTVTYEESESATGYDVVLGTAVRTVSGEKRPVEYGDLVKKNQTKTTVTFTNVPEGTFYVGMHAYNRTSEDGKKVFSPWANWSKKVTVK